MAREPRLDPMERRPPPCPCGAADSARAEFVAPACHVCRAIAAEHPAWTADEVSAAGLRKWTLLALTAIRRAAAVRPGEPQADLVFTGQLVWLTKDGYERLTIRGLEPGLVLEVLAVAHPDLLIADRHEGGGQLAVKLVARAEEVRDAA